MSKELNNITDSVMDQIHQDKIKMRPKMYFFLGSALTFVGLVSSMVVSVFLVGLIRFSLRSHGPRGAYRLDQLLASFPWWAVILAIVGLGVGIWLVRRYDFSYKVDFEIVIIGFVLAAIVGGWVVDSIGLNDALIRRGPMQGVMKQYLLENNLQDGQGGGPRWGRGF